MCQKEHKVFPKTFCCNWTVDCQKFVQYIRMDYGIRYIDSWCCEALHLDKALFQSCFFTPDFCDATSKIRGGQKFTQSILDILAQRHWNVATNFITDRVISTLWRIKNVYHKHLQNIFLPLVKTWPRYKHNQLSPSDWFVPLCTI